MKPTDMKAMLFAAGLGTRLKPFTQTAPKALFPVKGIPLLERNILYLKAYGISEIVINVHHFADQIIDFLAQNQNFGLTIHLSDERGQLLETGGGLVFAQEHFHQAPFLLLNADVLTRLNLTKLIAFHEKHRPLATLAVQNRKSSRKLLFDEESRLCGWKNTKTAEIIAQETAEIKTERAFSGVHILDPSFFSLQKETGKFSIIQSYLNLMQNNTLLGFDHSEDDWVDVGKPENLARAEELF